MAKIYLKKYPHIPNEKIECADKNGNCCYYYENGRGKGCSGIVCTNIVFIQVKPKVHLKKVPAFSGLNNNNEINYACCAENRETCHFYNTKESGCKQQNDGKCSLGVVFIHIKTTWEEV